MKTLPLLPCLLLLLSTSTPADPASIEPRQLSVRGRAELHIPADQVELDIGVITQASTIVKTTTENANLMQKLEKALLKIGIKKQEYETGGYQIQPTWSSPPRDNNPDWQPSIIGYNVTNRFHIKTTQLNLVADIIKAGAEAGANAIDSMTFNLSNPETYKDKAIKLATANAMQDAKTLATSASLQLGPISSITLDDASLTPVYRGVIGFKNQAMHAAVNDATTPISPGQVAIHSSVSLVYRIQ